MTTKGGSRDLPFTLNKDAGDIQKKREIYEKAVKVMMIIFNISCDRRPNLTYSPFNLITMRSGKGILLVI